MSSKLGVEFGPIQLTTAQSLDTDRPRHDPETQGPLGRFDHHSLNGGIDSASRVAEYLRLANTIGPALETQDQAEVTELLGARTESFQEADEKLEAFVLAAGPEQDETLIRFFHRRMLRQEATLKPAMRELEHAQVQLV